MGMGRLMVMTKMGVDGGGYVYDDGYFDDTGYPGRDLVAAQMVTR